MTLVHEAKERKVGLEARHEDMLARQSRELHDLRNKHEQEASELVQMLDALERVIVFEERSSAFSTEMEASGIKSVRQPLPEYVLRQIKLLKKASKEDLRASAARQGFFVEGDNGGRSIHACLLNLVRSKRIREVQPNSSIYEAMPSVFDLVGAAFSHVKDVESSPHGDAGELS